MWIRWTLVCAALAALTACSTTAPAAGGSDTQTGSAAVYPSAHNQFRELGWE